MKKVLRLLPVIILLGFSLPALAATQPGKPAASTTNNISPLFTMSDFLKLSPRAFEKQTGKKLRFKERIVYKLLQWKLRKQFKKRTGDEPTPKQIRQGNLSLVFGIGAIVLLFIPYIGILSIGLAIAGLVLGLKSLKGNSNTAGLIGVILSSLVLFLIVLVVVIISSIDWY